MNTIAVIDYGMGNLRSAAKALEKVAAADTRVLVTADPAAVRRADRVVFPGVGAIRDCMHELRRLGLDEVVRETAASGKPLLGICLGMQALMRHSEENDGCDGLGILPGEVKYFGEDLRGERLEKLKVPHMGWNQVHHVAHPLWDGIPQDARFYFVHGYYVRMDDEKLVSGRCEYGLEFAAAVARDNVFAVQFHPEKSQLAGLTLLANFTRWDGSVPPTKIH